MNSLNKTWQKVTLLKTRMVASDVKSLLFKLKNPVPFFSGQYYTIRIKNKDGYMIERDYSLANPPEENDFAEFAIQLIKEGSFSPYLFDLKPNDQVEISGPTGRHFIWDAKKNKNPLLIISAGSGLAPIRSIILHHFNNYKKRDIVLLVSFKSIEKVLYKEELEKLSGEYPNFKIIFTFTKTFPDKHNGYNRRIDKQMLIDIFSGYLTKKPSIFVCGPTPFVEVVTNTMINIGFNPANIKSERFG